MTPEMTLYIKRAKVSFFVANEIFTCDSINYVKLGIGNRTLEWLVDTGASLSAIKYECLENINARIYNSKLEVNGIGGSLRSEGFVYLKLEYNNKYFEHKFYVFRNLPCKTIGIIGQDFIKTHLGIINYIDNTLSLGGQNGTCVPLHFSEFSYSMTISPRCEVLKYVPTKVNYDCVVLPKELAEGVYMASVITTPRKGKIPIRIMNTTDRHIKVNLSNMEVHKLDDYDYCQFSDSAVRSSDRIKKLFSLLKLDYLGKEEQLAIEQVCAKFSDVFHLPGDKLTYTNIYEQKITLKDNVCPVYRKQYRIPFAQKNEVNRQVDEMLKNNVIEEASSEWSSPLLLVPKKEDRSGERKWRVVIDYRQLNERIQDDKFPLPNINEILDSLSGAMYYSHCDLSQGYFQCRIKKESRKYTAFTTDKGQYQMCRLPMGLKISPSAFSRLMTVAMSGLNHDKCLIYQDDLIIWGRNLNEHNANLMSVFSRLRKVNLKLNPLKCEFLKRQVLYLGHIISSKGILPDPNKVSVINNYPRPTSVDDVKRFVAFANYYRKFIRNFAHIVIPLNKLCRKNIAFEWTKECESSFIRLKECLSNPPVLDYPDFSEKNRFILQTDSSGFAVGSVLCNGNGKPVAYASRSLNKGELNYPIIEKELLAIVWAVKYFRPYLFGKKFTIRTDHKPLLYLFSMKDPSSRLTKFRLSLEQYDFDVEYVKGKENVAADALSRIIVTSNDFKEMYEKVVCVMTRAQARRMEEIECEDELQYDTSTGFRSDQPRLVEILKKQENDLELSIIPYINLRRLLKKYSTIIWSATRRILFIPSIYSVFICQNTLSTISRDELLKELAIFCKQNNIEELVIIKNKLNRWFIEWLASYIKANNEWPTHYPKFCIIRDVRKINSEDEKKVIMNDFHLLPSSGHTGIRRMVNNIKKYYYWPNLEKDVRNYIGKCDKCQTQKYTKFVKEPLTITTTASSSFEKVFLDLIGPLDRDDQGNTYILTLQCEITKYVEAYPLKTKTTQEVARAFAENFILRYGIPREIATDRGSEFISGTMRELCNILKVNQLMSTAYHHESIGSLENTHKMLGSYLRIQTNNNPSSWSSWVQYWCFSYNTTVHTETRYTPFELVFGQVCRLPNSLSNSVQPLYNYENYPLEFKYRLQRAQSDARKNLLNSKILRKKKFDQHIKPFSYKKGDKLYLKNETGSKLDSLYTGPYEVVLDNQPNVTIVKDGKEIIVHKNRTKPFNIC